MSMADSWDMLIGKIETFESGYKLLNIGKEKVMALPNDYASENGIDVNTGMITTQGSSSGRIYQVINSNSIITLLDWLSSSKTLKDIFAVEDAATNKYWYFSPVDPYPISLRTFTSTSSGATLKFDIDHPASIRVAQIYNNEIIVSSSNSDLLYIDRYNKSGILQGTVTKSLLGTIKTLKKLPGGKTLVLYGGESSINGRYQVYDRLGNIIEDYIPTISWFLIHAAMEFGFADFMRARDGGYPFTYLNRRTTYANLGIYNQNIY